MKNAVFFFALLWVLIAEAQAQQARRRLSYSQLFEEIQKHPDTVYRLENAEIYYNHETDHTRFGYVTLSKQKATSLGFNIDRYPSPVSPSLIKEFIQIKTHDYYAYHEIDPFKDVVAIPFGYTIVLPKYKQYLDSLLPVITIDKKIEFKNVYWDNYFPVSIRRFHFKKPIEFLFNNDYLPNTEDKFRKIPNFEKCEINKIEANDWSNIKTREQNTEKKNQYDRQVMN
ncbi:hypothetical protein [Raineya orbicola]|uniref:Uncharacterized protein n=1 Tax=Raineya orbicola TaxID=2016530 RepID=A0A2N3IJA4_9BACT|nr:hypothetical protein [Raineya orbicola]PKQ70404.1 hypothetical protein Rain11_0632 [Raineya orbicola]